MLLEFFDWFYSEAMGGRKGEPFTGRFLPEYPKWLCKLLTRHRANLHFSDRLADIGGCRCRCGEIEKLHD